jgi:hypothetical protein
VAIWARWVRRNGPIAFQITQQDGYWYLPQTNSFGAILMAQQGKEPFDVAKAIVKRYRPHMSTERAFWQAIGGGFQYPAIYIAGERSYACALGEKRRRLEDLFALYATCTA